jgi:uncharacterized protein with PQ loop repeat
VLVAYLSNMGDLLDYAPIAAAAFAIPQFLPQIGKLRATDDTAGVSWSWATLTSVNNAAWFVYFVLAGRAGLGTLLTAAFILQVTPSIWTAYRTDHPTGVSRGTWLLILGELSCWTIFGLHASDPRLLTLGLTGVTASALMLHRIRRTTGDDRAILDT